MTAGGACDSAAFRFAPPQKGGRSFRRLGISFGCLDPIAVEALLLWLLFCFFGWRVEVNCARLSVFAMAVVVYSR